MLIAAAPRERLLPRLLIVLKNYCPPSNNYNYRKLMG